jgi:hypothetical protein
MSKLSPIGFFKKLFKWMGRGIFAFIIFVFLFLFALQFSFTQTLLVQYALRWLSPAMKFDVSVKVLYFNPLEPELTIYGLKVLDRQKNVMLDIGELKADFDYENLLKNGNVAIKNVKLKRGSINLIADQKTGLLNINDFINVIDSLTAPKVRNPNEPPTIVDIQKFKLIDMRFVYADMREKPNTDKYLDFFHLKLNELNGELKNFHLAGDTIQMQINGLRSIEEKTNMEIKDLTTFYRMTRKSIEFHKIFCELNQSILREEIFFSFDKQSDLSDFNHKVSILAYLDNTILNTKDLALFAPAVANYKDIWKVSGKFEGKVNDFIIKDFKGSLGNNTNMQGTIAMKGLPDIQNTTMTFQLPKTEIDFPELFQYIQQPTVEPYMRSLGKVQFEGEYTGTIENFKAKGNLNTQLGNLMADIHLKPNQEYYDAKLNTQNFALGKLLQQEKIIGNVNLQGNVKGTGFSLEKAQLSTNMKINSIRLLDYNYQNLKIDGDLSQKSFKGDFIAKDKNLDIELKGKIDLSEHKKQPEIPTGHIDFDAVLNNINLKNLGFMKDETILKAKAVKIDIRGLQPDSLIGEIKLDTAFVLYNQKGLEINHLSFLSFKDRQNGKRLLDLQSDYADLHVEGKFIFSDLLEDLQKLATEYALSFRNEPKSIKKYYKNKAKEKIKEKYGIEFNAKLKNANPIIGLFDTKLFIAKDSYFDGKFSTGKTIVLNLATTNKIDSIFYGNNKIFDVKFEINTSKLNDKPDILAESSISSTKQKMGGIETKNLFATAVWGNNVIDFNLKTEQANTTNFVDLEGAIRFVEDTTLISFKPSKLNLLEKQWLLSKDNLISLVPKGILIKNLQLYKKENPESQIWANGEISEKLDAPLEVKIQEFDLLAFANIIGYDLRGTLNSTLSIQNLQQNPEIKGNLNIENTMLGDNLIGDIEGELGWNDAKQEFTFNSQLYRMGRFILEIDSATYKPNEKRNPLFANINFRRTDLALLESFTKGLISKLRGTAEGKLQLLGSFTEPHLLGNLDIQNARLRFDYLNTFYNADQIKADFTHNEIKINDAIIYDYRESPNYFAKLNMSIFHDNFKDFYLQSKTNFYGGFQLLNTTAKDNSLFYGNAYGTGSLSINGFLNGLVIDIKAKTQANTKIIMPMDGYAEVANQDYIQFLKEEVKKDTLVKKMNLGGMKLNFNLDVTPDAEFEIVFDKKAGDVLRATGRGNIEMKIDTEGDFKMFGNYNIEKGKYSVTLFNLINKQFDIKKGGNVLFNGDLYSSVLDVNAVYQRNVSMRPLFDADNQPIDVTDGELARTYPVAAVMNLKGSLFAPEIKLNLDITEAKNTIPSISIRSALMQLETRLLSDEQERNKQVFSILMMNNLAPRGEFTGVGSAATNSVSEFITNQLSNYFSQIDPNLQINLRIDPANMNMSQVRVSYSLLDGKFRITREGGFVNSRSQADVASVIGDWTLEYLLGSTGKYRLKMYNRTNQTVAGLSLNSQTAMSAGVSFVQTLSFDYLKEIWTAEKVEIRDDEAKEELKKTFEEGNKAQTNNEKPNFIKKVELFPLKHKDDIFVLHKNVVVQTPNNLNNSLDKRPKKQESQDEDNDDEGKRGNENNNVNKNKENNPLPTQNKIKFPKPHRFDEKI